MRHIGAYLLLLLCLSCYTDRKISNQNLAYLYRSSYISDRHHFSLVHTSADSSRLYLKLPTKGSPRLDSLLRSSLKGYLLEYMESRTPLDSFDMGSESSIRLDSLFDLYSLDIYTGSRFRSVLKIDYQISTEKRSQIFQIDRRSENSPQQFQIISSNFPLVDKIGGPLKISHYDRQAGEFYVQHFPSILEPAYPIFIIRKMQKREMKADTTFGLKRGETFELIKPGMYLIRKMSLHEKGLSLFTRDEDFPKPSRPETLLEALRYITKNDEFTAMKQDADPKHAVDKFWLNRAGSMERAKVLIKEYYTRVWQANELFSSYKPGWMTDRGLVYIIFGEPDIIYKSSTQENWIYEPKSTEPLLSLSFVHIDHEYSSEHYELVRNEALENQWHIGIHKWRVGNIRK